MKHPMKSLLGCKPSVKTIERVKTFRPVLEALEDRVLMSAGDILFTTYNQLYVGTPSGNTLIKDFGNATIGNLTVVNSPAYTTSRVYFTITSTIASNGTQDNQLWVSDGTSPGTQEVFNAGTGVIYSLAPIGDKIGFTLNPDTTYGADIQLWESNGTSAGTSIVKDFPNAFLYPQKSIGNQLYFTVTSSKPEGLGQDYETQLFITDGTSAGTVQVD